MFRKMMLFLATYVAIQNGFCNDMIKKQLSFFCRSHSLWLIVCIKTFKLTLHYAMGDFFHRYFGDQLYVE